MRSTQSRQYEMFLRVREFGDQRRALFPESSPGGHAFEALGAATAQLREQAVSKLATAREGRQKKEVARSALVRQIDLIGRCARVVARDVPGFDAPFKVPRPRSDQAFLTTGRVFTGEAAKFESQFIAYGMHRSFVAELTGIVDAFEQAIRNWEAGRNGHTAARASIDSALAAGLAAIRRLDIIVANEFRNDPVTMAVWEQNRRLEHSRRVRRVRPVEAASPGAPPVPSAAPTVDPATAVEPAPFATPETHEEVA